MVKGLVQPGNTVMDTMEYEIHFLQPEPDGGVVYCIITTDSEGKETWWESETSCCQGDIEKLLRIFNPDRVTVSCEMRDLSTDSPVYWACRLARSYNRGET